MSSSPLGPDFLAAPTRSPTRGFEALLAASLEVEGPSSLLSPTSALEAASASSPPRRLQFPEVSRARHALVPLSAPPLADSTADSTDEWPSPRDLAWMPSPFSGLAQEVGGSSSSTADAVVTLSAQDPPPVPLADDALPGVAASSSGGVFRVPGEEEPPTCPEEDSPLLQRIRPVHQAPLFQQDAECWTEVARALQVDDRESGWNGPVAIERSDGPRPPLTGLRFRSCGPSPGCDGRFTGANGSRLNVARRQLRLAVEAVEACEFQLRGRLEDDRAEDPSLEGREAAARAELAQVRSEASQLNRELQRLKGVPEELAKLTTSMLHTLQQELTEAMRNIQGLLEERTKCCICRVAERQVMLRPCQHLAMCDECARRVDRCPLCRSSIDRFEAVCVA